MQCLARGLGFVAIAALLAIGAATLTARHAAEWLASPDTPVKADAIVVLGDEPTRALEGAHLYAAGIAPRVLLTVPAREPRRLLLEREGVSVPWFEEAATQILLRHGVPAAAIGQVGHDLLSTAAEGIELRRLFPGKATLVVVTSPYHVRRARMILRDALPQATVLVVGSRYQPLPQAWWRDQEAARNILLEGSKYLYYVLGGRFTTSGGSARAG